MKTILVPTDYSIESRNALVFALNLAAHVKARIVLVHVFHQPLTFANATHMPDAVSALEEEKNIILKEFAAEVRAENQQDFTLNFISKENAVEPLADEPETEWPLAGSYHVIKPDQAIANLAAVKIKTQAKFGWPAEEILRVAHTHQADLLVMSTRGANALSQAFLGSTVAAIIGAGEVPVLALPPHTTYKPFKNIVFATDLNQLPTIENLRIVKGVADLFAAELKVLHLYGQADVGTVQEKTIKALASLGEQLAGKDFKVYFRQRRNIPGGIQEFATEQAADLLIAAPKNHTFLEKLLGQTVTGQLTEKPFMPFLTLPFAARPVKH